MIAKDEATEATTFKGSNIEVKMQSVKERVHQGSEGKLLGFCVDATGSNFAFLPIT